MTTAHPPRPRHGLSGNGPTVPVRLLPIAAGVLAAALVVVEFPDLSLLLRCIAGLAVGVVLAGYPDVLISGALVLLLSSHQVWHYAFQEQQGTSHLVMQSLGWTPRFAVLLAGAHLLHVLVSLAAALPTRGTLELAVLRRPALRSLAVQVPTQVAAWVVLTAGGPAGGIGGEPRPALGVVGGLLLGAVVWLLLSSRRRGGRPTP